MGIDTIKETKDFILINKPAGVLSQSDIDRSQNNIHQLVQDKIRSKVHLLTRLDRPVSGLVLLSKSKAFTKRFTTLQDKGLVNKKYLAVVQGHTDKDLKSIEHFIFHDKKSKKARISEKEEQAFVKCTLHIRFIKHLDNYTILEVNLVRGKFHQIRAQLSQIGHPIKGDVKYKARRKNHDRSIYLHAYKMEFKDLDSNPVVCEAGLPKNDNLWDIVSKSMKE